MKKRLSAALAAIVALGVAFTAQGSPAQAANGAPSGPHYNLNIIGVSGDKNPNMNQGSGNVIFVDLGTRGGAAVTSRILLTQADTFAVTDKNGTDGTAGFSLPAPGSYTVWARPLGTPGGQATMTTCGIDETDGQEYCSTLNKVFLRESGKQKFDNVTTELTTISLSPADRVATGCAATVSLFDPCLEQYLWKYDNQGLKLLQIRFYRD